MSRPRVPDNAKSLTEWSKWRPMPEPKSCRSIDGPDCPGVYQIRDIKLKILVLFGISKHCRKRMKSFFPAPYGTGKRNNACKREYVLRNWRNLEYRTTPTENREIAKSIEDELKGQQNHLFNT